MSAQGTPADGLAVPMTLHHYTDVAGLHGILQSCSLWATDVRCLNDASEIAYSRQMMKQRARILEKAHAGDWGAHVVCEVAAALAEAPTAPDTYVASLCAEADNLSQWRGYGGHAAGVAIGFDRERLWDLARRQDFHLVPLIYDVPAQEALLDETLGEAIPIMERWRDDAANAPTPQNQLLSLGLAMTLRMLAIKHPFFRDEREWRLARVALPGLSTVTPLTRSSREGAPIPYTEVALVVPDTRVTPLTEIVVGPVAELTAGDVRSLLDNAGFPDVQVRSSSGPLRAI